MYALKKTSIVRSVFFSKIAWIENYEKNFPVAQRQNLVACGSRVPLELIPCYRMITVL